MPVIDSVLSDSDFPKKMTVAVIGGGVIGVSTALELAERGVSVVLLEKGIIAGEQSSRNWGWCRQMGRDSREIPLVLESLKLWRGMNARIGAETGYRQSGIIYLAETEVELAAKEKWYAENVKEFGLDTRLVSGAEAERLQKEQERLQEEQASTAARAWSAEDRRGLSDALKGLATAVDAYSKSKGKAGVSAGGTSTGSIPVCTPGPTYDAKKCSCTLNPAGAGCPGAPQSGGINCWGQGPECRARYLQGK